MDVSAQALLRVRQHPCCRHALAAGRLHVQLGSFLQVDLRPWCLDTLVLLETIEHVPLQRLEALERQVFGQHHAARVKLLVASFMRPTAEYRCNPNAP